MGTVRARCPGTGALRRTIMHSERQLAKRRPAVRCRHTERRRRGCVGSSPRFAVEDQRPAIAGHQHHKTKCRPPSSMATGQHTRPVAARDSCNWPRSSSSMNTPRPAHRRQRPRHGRPSCDPAPRRPPAPPHCPLATLRFARSEPRAPARRATFRAPASPASPP